MTFHHRSETPRATVIKRVALYGIMFFVLGVAQCSFFANLTFLRAVPDIVLGAVTAVALLDSQGSAAVCGIASGFMIDALGGAGLSLSPLFYFLVALICAEISKKMLPNFFSWVFVLITSGILNSAFTFLYLKLSFENITFSAIYRTILLPEFLSTVIFSLPIFFFVKLFVRISDSKGRFKM